jgi:hypothetical protein
MRIKEVQKRDAFTQAGPVLKSMSLQCDRTREIKPEAATRQAPIRPLAAVTGSPAPATMKVHVPVVDLNAIDLDIDLSAPPDRDE